jgi:hypothetical protein
MKSKIRNVGTPRPNNLQATLGGPFEPFTDRLIYVSISKTVSNTDQMMDPVELGLKMDEQLLRQNLLRSVCKFMGPRKQ